MAFERKTLQRIIEDLTNNGKERFSTDQAPAMTTNTGHQLFHSSAKTVNKAIDSARESVKFTLRNRPGEFPPPGTEEAFPRSRRWEKEVSGNPAGISVNR